MISRCVNRGLGRTLTSFCCFCFHSCSTSNSGEDSHPLFNLKRANPSRALSVSTCYVVYI
jgi:hypothetical protein